MDIIYWFREKEMCCFQFFKLSASHSHCSGGEGGRGEEEKEGGRGGMMTIRRCGLGRSWLSWLDRERGRQVEPELFVRLLDSLNLCL